MGQSCHRSGVCVRANNGCGSRLKRAECRRELYGTGFNYPPDLNIKGISGLEGFKDP